MSFHSLKPLHLTTAIRTFTSSPIASARSVVSELKHRHSAIPPYPYGISPWYKQSNLGLYGLQRIRFGNVVSEKNEIKTRRRWRVNVQIKRLWSECLQQMIRLRVTTRVLRTIDKSGGLDMYLLGEKTRRIRELGIEGWGLKWRVLQTERCAEMFRDERRRLGLAGGAPQAKKGSSEWLRTEIAKYDEMLRKGKAITVGEGANDTATVKKVSDGVVLDVSDGQVAQGNMTDGSLQERTPNADTLKLW